MFYSLKEMGIDRIWLMQKLNNQLAPSAADAITAILDFKSANHVASYMAYRAQLNLYLFL